MCIRDRAQNHFLGMLVGDRSFQDAIQYENDLQVAVSLMGQAVSFGVV